MKSLDSLSSKEQYQVFGECLACLAYFAIEAKRCSRAEVESALANATRLHETPLLHKRLNWWNSKLGNIQWALQDHGLEGTAIHGVTLPIKKGRGRKGQAGTQARIKAFAIPLSVTRCSGAVRVLGTARMISDRLLDGRANAEHLTATIPPLLNGWLQHVPYGFSLGEFVAHPRPVVH